MTGKMLDSFSLFRPAEWEPDYVVRNLFEQYFISNYTSFDFLEDTGARSLLHLEAGPQVALQEICQSGVEYVVHRHGFLSPPLAASPGDSQTTTGLTSSLASQSSKFAVLL